MPDRARTDELAALTTIAALVNCTQALEEILGNALATTLQVVGVEAGEIYLLDTDTGELLLKAQQGLSPRFLAEEATLGMGECLCGLSIDSQQIVSVPDIAAHPARSRPACLQEGFQSLLCLPLRARGEVLGLLNVQSRNPRHFTAADEELLTAIGNQIGIAIANARLIDDAEQRRATLTSVMNSLVDGLILIDRWGKIIYANPCAAAMLALSPSILAGQGLEAVGTGLVEQWGDPAQAAALLEAATADPGSARPVELAFGGPAAKTLQARFFPIHDAAGANLGLGLLLRDITREKELDQMKSQLLSTVSHELRTPLSSIKGFATTLLREDVDWDETTRREFLSIIDQESDRLSELIGNLLDMSRIEAGTLRVEPEPTDLRPIVEDMVAGFAVMTRSHHLKADLPLDLPLVNADPRRVRQVLRNLVENAVKYSPGGGPITITLRPSDGQLQVSVSDRGIGIEPQYLDHLFDRFYQVDSASTRRVGGSGLGLSICKAIIEAHHGRIWVESERGVGSTFYFTLPLED